MNYMEADEYAAENGFNAKEESICREKRHRVSADIPTERLLSELHLRTELSAARIANIF